MTLTTGQESVPFDKLYQDPDLAEKILNDLKKEHPVLAQYQQLAEQRAKVSGYRGEKLYKALLVVAKAIGADKTLMEALARDLPKVAITVRERTNSNYEQVQER